MAQQDRLGAVGEGGLLCGRVDARDDGLRGEGGQVGGDVGVGGQDAALDELAQGDAGQELGGGGEGEDGVELHWFLELGRVRVERLVA